MTRQVIDFSTPEQREKLASVKFSEYGLADLAEAATTIFPFYHPEYVLPPPPWMLEDANLPRRAATSEKDFRRGVVGFVAGIWHEAKWYERNDGSQAGPYYWQGGKASERGIGARSGIFARAIRTTPNCRLPVTPARLCACCSTYSARRVGRN